MKTRPWPLVLLAALQILSPVGTVLVNAWALGIAPHYVLGLMLEAKPLRLFESLALMPLAGIAIYLMKPWSYAVFAGAMLWSLGANLSNWSYASESFSVIGLILLYLLQFGLVFYFLLPSVRKTYFDARMRWWETKRRFRLEIPVTVRRGARELSGRSLNFSEGGMLVRLTEGELVIREVILLRFEILGVEFCIEGEAVYLHPGSRNEYGVRFFLTQQSAPRLKALARALALIGLPGREAEVALPWYKSLGKWTLRLFKTGKGLTPEVSPSRPSAAKSPEHRSI